MLHLIINTSVRVNHLCSQSKASGEELELHRLQPGRKLRGDYIAALSLHLRQEG